MNNRSSTFGTKLQSLEKWRTSELDVAQVEHTRRKAVAVEKEKAVDDVQQVIDDSQDMVREQIEANSIISTESLTRLNHYTAVQLGELQIAQTQLAASQREVDDAHAAIVKKFSQLAVVERLRKRRGAQADKEALRRDQKTMDDQALFRKSESDRE